MTARRRTKTDSIQGALNATRQASALIEWPTAIVTPHSDPAIQARCDIAFRGLLTGRQNDDWRQSDIVLAARLARVQIMHDVEMLLLEEEGCVQCVGGKTGSQPVRNPRADVCSSLASQAGALHRALSLHGSPTDKREIHRAAKGQLAAREVIQRAAKCDLLA